MPFAAWLLTAMSKTYPGGEGDRRAFTYVIHLALAGIPYAVLLLALSPLLANYAWMNLFIFAGLFALGYAFTRQGGISLYGQCGMLFFVGAVGLNPQEPSLSANTSIATSVSCSPCSSRPWSSACSGPCCRSTKFAPSSRSSSQVAATSGKTLTPTARRAAGAHPPSFPRTLRVDPRDHEAGVSRGRDSAPLRTLASAERLSYCMLSARKLDEIEVPPVFEKLVEADQETVRQQCRNALRALENAFSRGALEPPAPPESLLAAFQPLELRIGEARQKYLSGEASFPKAIAWLGAMNFLEDATRLIDLCTGSSAHSPSSATRATTRSDRSNRRWSAAPGFPPTASHAPSRIRHRAALMKSARAPARSSPSRRGKPKRAAGWRVTCRALRPAEHRKIAPNVASRRKD